MPLFGDESKELAFGVRLRLEGRTVLGDGDEALREEGDDLGITECLPTGGDTVVSSATEWVTVHRPEKDRLAGLGSNAARLPKIDLPRDRLPPQLVRVRSNLRGDGAEVRYRRVGDHKREFFPSALVTDQWCANAVATISDGTALRSWGACGSVHPMNRP